MPSRPQKCVHTLACVGVLGFTPCIVERETETERQRETDRQTERDTQRERDRDRETEIDRQRQRETQKETDRQTETGTERDRVCMCACMHVCVCACMLFQSTLWVPTLCGRWALYKSPGLLLLSLQIQQNRNTYHLSVHGIIEVLVLTVPGEVFVCGVGDVQVDVSQFEGAVVSQFLPYHL